MTTIREQGFVLKIATAKAIGVLDEGSLDPSNMSSGAASSGQVLTADGVGGASWSTEAGLGDVIGPASATDGRVTVFDGATGKAIKEPVAAVDFGGQDLTNLGDVPGYVEEARQIIDGTGISGGGDLTADRTLSVDQPALDPSNMGSGAATSGQVLTADGLGGASWSAESGLGDVTGPASATDGRVAVFSGATGKVIAESSVAVDFNGQDLTNIGDVPGYVEETRQILDGTGISGGGNLSADRTLSVDQSALDPANMSSGAAAASTVATADGLGGVSWAAAASGGVSGPVSSTDDALARWDGAAGDTVQDSGVTLSDTGAMVFPAAGSVSKPGAGANSEAFGAGATAAAASGTALGQGAGATGVGSTVVGQASTADATSATGTVVGSGSSLTAADGTICGALASVASADGTALGHESAIGTSCAGGVAIGDNAAVHTPSANTNDGAIAIGRQAAVGNATAIVGCGAGVAIGNSASVGASSTNGVAIGNSSTIGANAFRAVAIGDGSQSSGSTNVAMGWGANSGTGAACLAIGPQAISNATSNAVAFGSSANCAGTRSTTIGNDSSTSANDTVSLGYNNDISGSSQYAIAVGNGIQMSSASDSIAMGRSMTLSTSVSFVAIGAGVTVSAANSSVAIGNSANASHAGSVALGQNAATTAAGRCNIGASSGGNALELQIGNGLGVWGVTPPGSQPAKINDPTGGATIDSEARTAINAILDVLEGAGLSST